MKLFISKTSPYARMTLVAAHEAGLADRVETVWLDPWNDPAELIAVNPAARVPALVTDDGIALVDSGSICDYLIALSARASLLPAALPGRAATLERLGLGRAVIDCAFGAVIQRRFNGGADTPLSTRWLRALPRLAAALEGLSAGRIGQTPDLGDLAIAVAFDYIDFRLPEVRWADSAPTLKRLVSALGARASLQSTRPA